MERLIVLARRTGRDLMKLDIISVVMCSRDEAMEQHLLEMEMEDNERDDNKD